VRKLWLVYLLFFSNGIVPVSSWHGRCMLCTKCHLVLCVCMQFYLSVGFLSFVLTAESNVQVRNCCPTTSLKFSQLFIKKGCIVIFQGIWHMQITEKWPLIRYAGWSHFRQRSLKISVLQGPGKSLKTEE